MKRAVISVLAVAMVVAGCGSDDKGENASGASSTPAGVSSPVSASSPATASIDHSSMADSSMDHSSMDGASSSASAAASPPAVTSATASSPTASPPPPADGTVIRITFAAGKVTTDDKVVKLKLGSKLTLVVTSDAADEVHVHGYDHKKDVGAGATIELAFTADQPGSYEVEMEKAQQVLVKLQIT